MRKLVLTAVVMMAVLTGCSSGGSPADDQSPEDRLAQAKRSFDAADYINFSLTADSLPSDLEGLLSAEGTGTHDPAFTGEVKVQAAVPLSAPLIAVNGTVYVQLPFIGWTQLDPADYGAPDPANLMDPQGGISSLFTASTALSAGKPERSGEQILTPIDATLPGDAVEALFPSAGSDDFAVTYTLTDRNDIHSVQITGPFYDGSPDVTYLIDLNLDADPVDIEAPH